MKIPTTEEKKLIGMIQKGLAYSIGEARGTGYSIVRRVGGEFASDNEVIGSIRNVFVPFRRIKKKVTRKDVSTSNNEDSNGKNKNEYFPSPGELCEVYKFSPYGHQTWFNGRVTEINPEQRRICLEEGFSISNGDTKERYFSLEKELTFFKGNVRKIFDKTEFYKGLKRAKVFAGIGEYEI